MKNLNEEIFKSQDIVDLDKDGSFISGVKLDVSKTYPEIPALLQQFIDNNDENSWIEISNRIDYLYYGVSVMLDKLDQETTFMYQVQKSILDGKILVFKPNLMAPAGIDPSTHGKGSDIILNTQWPLLAAIMRWFHDNGKIHYSHMALAEGSCSVDVFSILYTRGFQLKVTNEAVFEGHFGDFYGGWGFYFVRKYLSSHNTEDIDDNPMNGYEESINGIYLAPGEAKNKMMVYDINKIQVDPSRGRTIHVPAGQNFTEITLHKVLIGGDVLDLDDLKLYPGCVLINVPVLKMHSQDLLSNCIKNLGIGLYPSQCTGSKDPSDTNWLYASPNNGIPLYKCKLPHSPWVLKIDEETHLPVKDESGNYIARKTTGFSGTQCDIVKAIQSQGTLMLHISDNINIINISHAVSYLAIPVPEGYLWASLDCVALDNFCARYCFNNLKRLKGKEIQDKYHLSTEFLQKVPVAVIKNNQIVTKTSIDSPLLRYSLYKDAEKRGIGYCSYHIRGINLVTNSPMASYFGHLVEESNNKWNEVITNNFYYNTETLLYCLQATVLSYAICCDTLYHTHLYKEIMDMLDENHDEVIDYNEKGLGFETAMIEPMSYAYNLEVNSAYGSLKKVFIQSITFLKYSNTNWNPDGHDFLKAKTFLRELSTAFSLSQVVKETPDLFYKNIVYGNGIWPSYKTAKYINNMSLIYGGISLESISINSAYGCLFQYYDKVLNNSYYTKDNTTALSNYFKDLNEWKEPLNFTFYVPVGFGNFLGVKIPNTVETDDSKLIFTAHFEEIW